MDHSEQTLIEAFSCSGGFFRINKRLIITFGIGEALYISNLIDNYRRLDALGKLDDKWFYVTYETQSKQTGISDPRTFRKYKNKFIQIGGLETKRQGLPAKEYYRLNLAKLEEFLCLPDSGQQHSLVSGSCTRHSNKKEIIRKKLPKGSSTRPPVRGMKNKVLNNVRKKKSRPRKRKVNSKTNHRTKETSAIIKYWGKQTLLKRKLKISTPPTNIYKKTTQTLYKMMHGTLHESIPKTSLAEGIDYAWFSKKWTVIEIKKAISNINDMCKEGNLPAKKEWLFKLTLDNAIFNPRTGSSVLMKSFHDGVQPLINPHDAMSMEEIVAFDNFRNYFKKSLGELSQYHNTQLVELVQALSGLREKYPIWGSAGTVGALANHYISFLNGNPGWSSKFVPREDLTPRGLKYKGWIWNEFVKACYDSFDKHPVTGLSEKMMKADRTSRSKVKRKNPDAMKRKRRIEKKQDRKDAKLKEKRRLERLSKLI